MDKTKRNKLIIFIVTGGIAWIGLILAGRGEQALELALRQLEPILSLAIGGICVILMPKVKDTPGPPPLQPTDLQPTSAPVEPQVPASAYAALVGEVEQWRRYGSEAETHMAVQEGARVQSDIRQTVLRTGLFGVVGLAFFCCVAGFLAPKPLGEPGVLGPEAAFLRHLAYLTAAFALGGFIIGTVIDRVNVPTSGRHACRAAVIAAGVLSVGSLLVSLPYVFERMLNATLTFADFTVPFIVWMTLFRVIVAPLTCAVFAYCGFKMVGSPGRRSASANVAPQPAVI